MPELCGSMYSALVYIASAQQRGIPVADFQLQLSKAAEVAQVVTRKGVA